MGDVIDLDRPVDTPARAPRRRRTGLIAGLLVAAIAVLGVAVVTPPTPAPPPPTAPAVAPSVQPGVLEKYVAAADAAAKRDAGHTVVAHAGARPLVGFDVADQHPRMVMDSDETALAPGTYTLTAFCAGTGRADFSMRVGTALTTRTVACGDPVKPVRQVVDSAGGSTEVSVVASGTSVVGAAYRLERG
jgi:hypothetical protein